MNDLIVIIPALNEAHNIIHTIESVQAGSPLDKPKLLGPDIYVVDGGSSDATVDEASRAGAKVSLVS